MCDVLICGKEARTREISGRGEQVHRFFVRKRGQGTHALLKVRITLMSQLHRVCKTMRSLSLILALPTAIYAQTNAGYIPYGTEYAPAGNVLGEHIYPDGAATANGGYAVWEDNI